jgi:hypothetical protein
MEMLNMGGCLNIGRVVCYTKIVSAIIMLKPDYWWRKITLLAECNGTGKGVDHAR